MFLVLSSHFELAQIMFFVMFFLVFAVIISVWISAFVRMRKNDKAPRLTVPATVVGKRAYHSSGSRNHSGTTTYYVTFQVESGDRMELSVYGEDYGLLIEGDQGELTFQGTRFVSFGRY